jgi:hypothetical protein
LNTPLKKLAADENELLKLLERWRMEAEKAGHKINRIAVAFETGRNGFCLKCAFLGWLRSERDHCKMAAIPTLAEEDAKRPHRERETLVGQHTSIINRIKATLTRLGIRRARTENAPRLRKKMIVALALQAANRLVAFRPRWRGARGRRPPSGILKGDPFKKHLTVSAPVHTLVTGRR